MMKRIYTILTLLLIIIVSATSQIRVEAPSHVAVGEQFRLQYTVNTTDVKGFRAGNIPDALEVLMGPSTSTQQSFQMVNGHTSSSSSITYTYILCASRNGSYTIGSAHATVNGRAANSSAVKITVSGRAQSSQSSGIQSQRGAQVRPRGSHISGNDLFIRVSANKKRVHEQEPVLLTYKVYTQVELTQLEGKMPDLNGFHTQEVPLPQQKSFHLESVNGKPYRCVTWSQYVMYPQMTGKLDIPSITFKGIVVQENQNVDPFEAFFNGGSGYVEVKKDIVAPGMTIQVDPLPAKPSGYSGGVGKFSISSSIDKNTVKAGDPVSIRIVIGGNGNLKLLKQPILDLPKDFDKYDPKVTDKTKLTGDGLTGNMVYDYLVVPRNQGKYTIPPVEFTYFDTSSNSYKTLKTQPITLNVDKGDGKSGGVADYSKRDEDIHAIHEGMSNLKSLDDYFYGSALYWVINVLVVAVFIALCIIFRKRALEMADTIAMKDKKANKVAAKKLKKAATLMAQGKSSDFYDEVLRALWGYVSDKLNMPSSELSRENIAERLSARCVEQNVVDSFIEALDECEFERYAPGDATGNMQKTYDTAVSAITNIEEAMKKKDKRKSRTDAALGVVVAFILLGMCSVDASAKNNAVPDKITADIAYDKGNYQEAVSLYEEILKHGEDANVYYNLGNAYYRIDNIAKAVLNYERALLFDPGNNDIRHNLEVAQGKTIDRLVPTDDVFFVSWYKSLVGLMGIDAWAYTSLIALVVALVMFLVYLFAQQMLLRKICFFSSIAFVIVFVLGNIFAWQMHSNVLSSSKAVVMSEQVTAKKTPVADGAEVMVIHEGTCVKVTDDSMKDWVQIEISDGREGWIPSSSLEMVSKASKVK